MKYRLSRELPFAKVGTEVIEGDYISVKNLITKDGGSFFVGYDLDKLIREGWIEEVKPREWLLQFDDDGIFCGIVETKDNFKTGKELWHNAKTHTIEIKVREVL